MWETIERMTDDRLWVYTAIAGSIFSALFIAYMRDTKILDARLSKLESKKK